MYPILVPTLRTILGARICISFLQTGLNVKVLEAPRFTEIDSGQILNEMFKF